MSPGKIPVDEMQSRLDEMGKRVDLIPNEYQGSQFNHINPVKCRDCGSKYRVNGDRLFSKESGLTPGCDRCEFNRRQKIIDDNGYLIRLISSNGTQQTDENDIICLGCNAPYTVRGNLLFRKPIQSSFPGCNRCQIAERAEKQQQRLDEMGKRVDIITSLYEGSQIRHTNWVRCRDCGDTNSVNGRILTQGGNPTPGCARCTTERKREHGREVLAPHREGPKYGIEEAQRKLEALDKPGRGTIVEWNGTSIGTRENRIAAPAIFLCECGRRFDTTGSSIMNPNVSYNGCPVCGPKSMREANLNYDLESAKAAISRNQKRDLDLSRITSFHSVNDRVDVICKTHNVPCEDKHLWRLMQGTSPCGQCRADMIGEAHAAGWVETEEEMSEVEGAHITYVESTYRSRQRKMLKHCSKEGHNPLTDGYFRQAPKQTILQGSSCPDCGREAQADKRRTPVDVLETQFFVIHGDRYKYPFLEDEYVNDRSKISIECPSHGIYDTQTAGMHKQGQGCPECARQGKRSMIEVKLMFEVGQFFPEWRPENITVEGIEQRIGPVDGILSETDKIILEFDGYWWHCKDDRVENDKRKTSILEKKGWVVYRVRQGELPEIEKAVNIRVQGKPNLKSYADDVIKKLIENGDLARTPGIEKYLQSETAWRVIESRDWFYANCRKN